MKQKSMSTNSFLVFLLVSLLLCSPAFAERHDRSNYHESKEHDGNSREHRNRESNYRRDSDRSSIGVYFGDQHRTYIHEYYQEEFQAGHCPPGLAKKYNGCRPPGHVRTWRRGYPLPRDVVFYDISPSLTVRLGPPPPRHRYIRVAADILLIAIGTGLVVDSIEDLGDVH